MKEEYIISNSLNDYLSTLFVDNYWFLLRELKSELGVDLGSQLYTQLGEEIHDHKLTRQTLKIINSNTNIKKILSSIIQKNNTEINDGIKAEIFTILLSLYDDNQN